MIQYGLKAYVAVPLYANLYDVRIGWAVIEENDIIAPQRLNTAYQPRKWCPKRTHAGTTWLVIYRKKRHAEKDIFLLSEQGKGFSILGCLTKVTIRRWVDFVTWHSIA